jgi:hypothetical protein
VRDVALDAMRRRNLVALTVVEEVRTGRVVAVASSDASLGAATVLPPLSVVKLLLAASWWDRFGEGGTVSVHEMLVGGSDSAGRKLATELRRRIGAAPVVAEIRRYASTTLGAQTSGKDWAETLSLGEVGIRTDILRVSRFLQAAGNGGVANPGGARVMKQSTAARLTAAMRDAVSRGSARDIAGGLSGTGWSIGGKTGTGPGPDPIGPRLDGWFAGLVFDPSGRAVYAVTTYVRHGGRGGGNAARVCAEVARYLAGIGH